MTARVIREVFAERRGVPLWVHPEWRDEFPWLIQGVTGRGGLEPFDLGLFGTQPVGSAVDRWRLLRRALAVRASIHARQVHGREVAVHDVAPPDGLVVMEGVDGHVTRHPDAILAVTVADCVPVSLLDPGGRAVGAVHAGWKGVAAGILEEAIDQMTRALEAEPDAMHIHFGPAICGQCYEVGPEVHAAVYPDRSPPPGPRPIDLRRALAGRALACGASSDHLTVSAHCTRCGPGEFFSHRGGDPARQVSLMGLRESA